MKNSPKYIVVHCSDVSYTQIADQYNAVNKSHKDRFGMVSTLGSWIGYHRIITGGKNYKCKEDWEEGAHTNQTVDGISMNLQSLAVCIGFDGDMEMPLDYQYTLASQQIMVWMEQYSIPWQNVKMHRFYNTGKTCPGSLITQEYIDSLSHPQITTPPPPIKPFDQRDKQEDILTAEEQNNIRYVIIQIANKVVSLLKVLLVMNY